MKCVKILLMSLFLGIFGLICFCNATEYTCTNTECTPTIVVFDPPFSGRFYTNLISQSSDNLTLHYKSKCHGDSFIREGSVSIQTLTEGPLGGIACTRGDKHFQFIVLDYLTSEGTVTFSYTGDSSGGGTCPECPTCPEVNTGEILSGYILESEIDTNYCVGNGLCPNYDLSGVNWSNLFVNGTRFTGNGIVDIWYPQYLTSSVEYIDDTVSVDINNIGNQDFINGVISNSKSVPNKDNFNQIITGLLPLFVPGLVVILFLWFIFKLIKKIF